MAYRWTLVQRCSSQDRQTSGTPQAGITAYPDGAGRLRPAVTCSWTLTSAASARFLIRDRAGQFTDTVDAVFAAAGIRILLSPPQVPRANAMCERMIATLRREVPGRLLIINERHLNQVLAEYLRHYNTAWPHRTLGQLAPLQAGAPPPQINLAAHRIRRKQVLSGLASEYRAAA